MDLINLEYSQKWKLIDFNYWESWKYWKTIILRACECNILEHNSFWGAMSAIYWTSMPPISHNNS